MNILNFKRFISNQDGFSFVELVFVMAISGILAALAITKLELQIKKGLKTIQTYSKNGFKAAQSAGEIGEKIRLFATKRLVRSYIISAKDFYMSNSYLPLTAKDLSQHQLVLGCQPLPPVNDSVQKKICIPLGDKLNVSKWDTLDSRFLIKMNRRDRVQNIFAIPYAEESDGISACYNTTNGVNYVIIVEKMNSNPPNVDC